MAEVVWTPRAYADLEAIGDYYAQEAPGYAETVVRKLLGATEQLESFPASGRMVPEIEDEDLREVIYRNYRIIYMHLLEEDKVEVLSVVHASRHLGGLPGTSES
ncbi:MAG: type II toxin-antitoxin system RelE/ParE family toxin [Bacteroidetes bacterium]|jgi:plasmid stabilization system protein ParE|nr:type II toxin-antitoxin system RelE/ParE family toxin [Bacteroidota bacterium]